jgi:hypothetical protein
MSARTQMSRRLLAEALGTALLVARLLFDGRSES